MQNLHSNKFSLLQSFQFVPILLGAVYLSGCSSLNPTTSSTISSSIPQKPKWIFETSKEGKAGGVGISKPHFNGKAAQRILAISRALDEIARQMGVEVNNIQKISTTGTSQDTTTTLESYSFQTTNGKIVTAKVQSFWEDTTTDELYVWLVVE
jgi:hypothetical protein